MTLGAARVIWTIQDLSMFVDEIVRGYVIMVIQAERGPMAKPKIISSVEEYTRIFGKKVDYTQDPLVCEMALRQGARLILIRTANYTDITDRTSLTALSSHVTLKDRGDIATHAAIQAVAGPYALLSIAQSGRAVGSEIAPYTFVTGASDKLLIKVGSGADQEVTLVGSNQTVTQVCNQINAQTSGLTASANNNRVQIAANTVTDGIQIKLITNDAYSVLGLNEATYAADPGTDKLVISVNGGADQTFTLAGDGSNPFTLTASQVMTQLAALTGASVTVYNGALRITSTATGPQASLQVKSSSTCEARLGLDNDVHTGADGEATDTLKFTAKDPGVWGDNLAVQISESALDPVNLFNVKIIYSEQGDLTEYYGDLSMDPTSKRYAPTFINERSSLVTVEDLESNNAAPSDMPAVNAWGTLMAGGDNGLAGFCDADWIGHQKSQTGMYAADDAPYMAMDIMIPGTTSVTVFQALITYCEGRGDLLAYGQVPWGMFPEETVDWRMGNAPWSHPAFNSHRFSLWFGRPLVYNDLTDSREYVSCLGHLAACICRTDNEYDYFYAPVGPRRGTVSLCEGVDFNIQGFRGGGYADLFAEYGINYLMISHLPGIEGAMFWEHRTTLRVASALRELNVMRFITMMYRVLMPLLRTFIFQPNHPVTWREIHRALQPAFEDWKNRYGIYDYALQCDKDAFFDGGELRNAVINTGLDIDRGIYHCRALIQPTKTIYYLEFELGVMRTGVAFENYLEMKELPGWVRR